MKTRDKYAYGDSRFRDRISRQDFGKVSLSPQYAKILKQRILSQMQRVAEQEAALRANGVSPGCVSADKFDELTREKNNELHD